MSSSFSWYCLRIQSCPRSMVICDVDFKSSIGLCLHSILDFGLGNKSWGFSILLLVPNRYAFMLPPSFLALEWFASITFQIKTIVLETEEQWKAALCIKISFLCSFHKFWFCRYPLYIPCIIRSAVYNIIAPYNCKLSLASQCILSDF